MQHGHPPSRAVAAAAAAAAAAGCSFLSIFFVFRDISVFSLAFVTLGVQKCCRLAVVFLLLRERYFL